MGKKPKRKRLSTKDIIELIIEAVIAIAALITALKSQLIADEGGRKPSPISILTHAVGKYNMNTRKFFVLLLASNLIIAIVNDWHLVNKLAVSVNAIALLFFVVRKSITKED